MTLVILAAGWRTAPGSAEARVRGCVCPTIDNAYGVGQGLDENGETIFTVVVGCPEHDPSTAVGS